MHGGKVFYAVEDPVLEFLGLDVEVAATPSEIISNSRGANSVFFVVEIGEDFFFAEDDSFEVDFAHAVGKFGEIEEVVDDSRIAVVVGAAGDEAIRGAEVEEAVEAVGVAEGEVEIPGDVGVDFVGGVALVEIEASFVGIDVFGKFGEEAVAGEGINVDEGFDGGVVLGGDGGEEGVVGVGERFEQGELGGGVFLGGVGEGESVGIVRADVEIGRVEVDVGDFDDEGGGIL